MRQNTFLNNQYEAAELSLTNAIVSLIQYLKDTYDLTATVEYVDGNFQLYFNGYDLEQPAQEDKLCKDIERVWNKCAYGVYKAVWVSLESDGYYKIGTELNYAEDVALPQSDDIFLTESTLTREEMQDINHSNDILDNKFIWLFSIMDSNSNLMEENIETLAEALDIFIKGNGAILVAIPYIDPAPDNETIDLVLADNPGPTILYDREIDEVSEGEEDVE